MLCLHRHRHRQDITDNVTIDSDLRVFHAMAYTRTRRSDQLILHASMPSTSPSMRLPPIEHRAAVASPLPGQQRRHLWSTEGAYTMVFSRCTNSRPAMPSRAAASLHAVTFVVPRAPTSALPPSVWVATVHAWSMSCHWVLPHLPAWPLLAVVSVASTTI